MVSKAKRFSGLLLLIVIVKGAMPRSGCLYMYERYFGACEEDAFYNGVIHTSLAPCVSQAFVPVPGFSCGRTRGTLDPLSW